DAGLRTDNLKAQASIANLLAENVDLTTQPWNQLSQVMAEFWMVEAENTFTHNTGSSTAKSVAPEDVLTSAPSEKWAGSLPPGLRQRIDVSLSKVILAGAKFDQAADRIVEIGKRTPEAGVALAEDFLNVWARAHNPQIPETLRK